MKDSQLNRARRRRGRRGRLFCLAIGQVLALALMAASAASAYDPGAGLADGGSTLSYVAGPEANNVTIACDPLPSGGCDSAGNYTITDSGASSIPNADTTGLCSFSAGPPSQAICPAANVTLIRVDASGGNDTVVVDALITTTANLLGGDGNDTLTGGLGDDSLQGNLGSDTVSYFNAPARVTVDLGVSTAQDTGGAGMDTISPGVENLTGSAFNDVLMGDANSNNLRSGKGDDRIDSRDGVGDQVFCDGGTDTAISDPAGFLDPQIIDVLTNCETVDDAGIPNTTIDQSPFDTRSTTVTFVFSGDPQTASFECQMDLANWESCTSPKTFTDLARGSHTFNVRAVDQYGHTDATPATRTFSIEFNPSPVTASSPPPTVNKSAVVVKLASSFVLIAGRTIRVSRSGLARITLNCSGSKDCSGRLTLTTANAVKFRHHRRIVSLGTKKFFIRAPLTSKINVRLSKRKLRLVKRLRRLPATLRVTDRDRAGRLRISTRAVILRAP